MAAFEIPGEEKLNILLGEFLEQYKNFDESCSPANIGSDPVLLLFGTSKAGKSAFTARLKSKLPGAAFRVELPVAEGERKVIEDITIGCGVNSTTVFPKINRLDTKGYLVCDMPGLKDTHETNKAIISILHKCLFKRVSKAKMLIVVDIRKLSIAAADIAESYYSELKDLFGEHFFDCLSNCYFILTHGDTVEDPQAIINTIPSKVMELLSANNNGGAQFFNRLFNFHMVINYNTTTPDMILTKISQWMAGDKFMDPQKFVHDNIVAAANIINRRCVEVLQKRIEEETKPEFLSSVKLSVKDYRDEYNKKKEKVLEEVVTLEKAIDVKKMNESETELAITQRIPQIAATETAKKEAEDVVTAASNNLKQAGMVLTGADTVEMVRLKSYESVKQKSGMIGSKEKTVYQIRTLVKKSIANSATYGAVVCTNPEVFQSICEHLNKSENIGVLSTETNSHVKYNSMANAQATDPNISIVNSGECFAINIELSEPFEVLLAYPMTLSTSPALVRFRDVQDRKLRKASDDLKKATEELNTLTNDKNNKTATLNRLRAARADFETKLNEQHNLLKEMATTYTGQLLENQAKVESKLTYLRSVKNGGDASINNMNTITRILKSNELDYSLNDYMREYEILIDTKISTVETVLNHVNELLAKI